MTPSRLIRNGLTEDLKKFDVPTLNIHGDDDPDRAHRCAGRASAKIVKNATLKVYPGAPHGWPTRTGTLNADLLAFISTGQSHLSESIPAPTGFSGRSKVLNEESTMAVHNELARLTPRVTARDIPTRRQNARGNARRIR